MGSTDKTERIVPFPRREIYVEGSTDPLYVHLRARQLLLEHGWIQHESHNEDGFSLDYAITFAVEQLTEEGLLAVPMYARRRALQGVAICFDAPDTTDWWPVVVRWNDARGRTKAEVLAALGEAIEIRRRHLIFYRDDYDALRFTILS